MTKMLEVRRSEAFQKNIQAVDLFRCQLANPLMLPERAEDLDERNSEKQERDRVPEDVKLSRKYNNERKEQEQ